MGRTSFFCPVYSPISVRVDVGLVDQLGDPLPHRRDARGEHERGGLQEVHAEHARRWSCPRRRAARSPPSRRARCLRRGTRPPPRAGRARGQMDAAAAERGGRRENRELLARRVAGPGRPPGSRCLIRASLSCPRDAGGTAKLVSESRSPSRSAACLSAAISSARPSVPAAQHQRRRRPARGSGCRSGPHSPRSR